jgi:hypothetical protein
MLGAIGATIGKIFGTDKALTAMVEGARSGIDKLIYTGEEKADDAAKDRSEARQMIIAWMASTSGQNIARRLIALSIVGVWLMQFVSMNLLSVVAVWIDKAVADKMIESATIIGGFADKMSGAVMLILAFYFAAPYMGSMVQGAMDKFAGKK